MLLVGIDAATKAAKVGVAWGTLGPGPSLVVERAEVLSRLTLAPLAERIRGAGPEVLVAIDAPLGWPTGLGSELPGHRAGAGLSEPADQLFSRACDRMVWRQLRKRPLEVGANLIARTACAALGLLEELRKETGLELDLAWAPGRGPTTPGVLEVYPAATRLSRGMRKRDIQAEFELLQSAGLRLGHEVLATAETNEHVRDALTCCLAAADYVEGDVYRPEDPDLYPDCTLPTAQKEGWIWIRRGSAGS